MMVVDIINRVHSEANRLNAVVIASLMGVGVVFWGRKRMCRYWRLQEKINRIRNGDERVGEQLWRAIRHQSFTHPCKNRCLKCFKPFRPGECDEQLGSDS